MLERIVTIMLTHKSVMIAMVMLVVTVVLSTMLATLYLALIMRSKLKMTSVMRFSPRNYKELIDAER